MESMTGKGKLAGVSRDWKTGKMQLTFQLDTDVTSQLDSIADKDLSITVKVWREHRSLSANAYYHVLLGKVADAMHISTTRAHNMMLRKYGQNMVIDGKLVYVVIPDTDEAEETALEASTFHIKPTGEARPGTDGKVYRTYKVLRGSHEYDTKEMSQLIDGLVDEAKELGIETLTPEQLQEMYLKYDRDRKQAPQEKTEMRNLSGLNAEL